MPNYNLGIVRQVEELTIANERLQSENSSLKNTVRELRQELNTLKNSLDAKIAKAVEKVCTPLRTRIKCLEQENLHKDEEIQRLKAQINKDSSNSSKPSSQDGFKKILNSREKSDKKVGGQIGHKGSTLTIPKNLDELVKEGKAEHRIVDLTDGAEKFISKWGIGLKPMVVFTEYLCPTSEMPCVFYEDSVKAIAVLLSNMGLIARERLSEFFESISSGLITVSVATLEKFDTEAASKVDIEAIKQEILNDSKLHIDETLIRCAQLLEYNDLAPKLATKTTFDAIIRTHSTETATLYTVNPHKDDTGIRRDDILPKFHGILSHDHDKKYYKYGNKHATCGAHLSRELKGLHELYKIEWGDKFRKFHVSINDYKNQTAVCAPDKLVEFEAMYDELVNEGQVILNAMTPKSFGYKELSPMVKRLRNYKDAYLLFIRDYTAPFTNNQAERDLRHCKTKQKISGCFRTWKGILCYARINSLLSTAKKKGQNLLDAIKELFKPKLLGSC